MFYKNQKLKKLIRFMWVIMAIISINCFVAALSPISAEAAYDTNTVRAKIDNIYSNIYPQGSKFTGSFGGGSQCMGFANRVFNLVFGYTPFVKMDCSTYSGVIKIGNSGTSASSIKNLMQSALPGDFIEIQNKHSMIFYSSDANGIKVYDSNWIDSLTNGMHYMTWAQCANTGRSFYLFRATNYPEVQNPPQPVNNPIGVVDSFSGKTGMISVSGWAFDKDDISKCLLIHVYIGGPAGSANAEFHEIAANISRPDVNKAYGCGNNHGFGADIPTAKTGSQQVYIYAINIGSGGNVLIRNVTVNIKPVNNPIGVVDSFSGKTGMVSVAGWAFDKDDISKCLSIHVYIGGPAGSANAEFHEIAANISRPDVNKAYGCGNNHGFGADIPTAKTGSQQVYIYAINIGSGGNVLIRNVTVNITKDTEQPKITRTYISEVTRDSYRVCAEISDNCGIKNVLIATWSQDGQTDLKWRGANYNGAGTYFIDIKRSEHSQLMNSLYYNHIYAYDYAGNCSVAVRDMDYRIKSDTGKNIAEGEYRIVTAKDSDFALNAANGGVTEGTNIQLYKNTSDKDQTFNISYVGDGFYKIIGTKSGLVLDVYGEKYQLETNVMLSKYHAGANQQWMLKKLSDGVYSIVSRSNGLVLDFYKGIYENCTNVQVYEQNGGYNQQWKLKRVLKDSMVNFNITDVYRSNYLQQIDKINVKVDGKKLVRDVDYEVSYMLKDGRLSYVVMGKGNYCDKVVKTYTLKKEPESENESVKVPTVKPTEKETTAKPTEKQTTVRPTEKETETFEKEHTHSYTSTITKAATCTDNGIKTYKCSCGKSYTEIIEKTGHQHTHIRNSILADCTTEGYTGDTYCSDCGQKISSGNVIPQKGHKWDSGVITKNATSSEEGIKTYTCKVCGEKRTETIPMIKIPGNGTIITDWQAGSQYKVIKSGVSGGTVEYKRPLSINVTVVNIPNTITYSGITYKVTSIAANAFKLNDNLRKVTMGDNIVEIGENAFANRGKLVSVKMSNNLVKIGDKAFYKCKSLTKITIPYKVRKIGYKAFYRCSNLKNIDIKTKKLTAKNVGKQAFKGISSGVVFKVPADRVSSYKKILKAVGIGVREKIR